ncbi:MAG: hypothetical protein P4L92_00595 [Rudaea sp.]|nr:hypothetical protein [Rudaea sp.]
MKRNLHWWIILLFLLALGYDLVVWGAAARLPEVGPRLLASAQREAALTYAYMRAGSILDAAVPLLDDWGSQRAQMALGEGFARVKDDPRVAMDLVFSQTWNAQHLMLKFCHSAAPVLAVIALVFWVRRPKKIRLMGQRRR